ncbi:MAG: glycerol kinase GlpK [Tepidisphaeraceae bacterium]
MPRYIAAIDQGTTSTRCILFDRAGPVVTAQQEHRQIFPKPGWVEHDPMEIWQRTRDVIEDALDTANVQPGDIAAVGITNQRETTVAWDRLTGRPYCNAIVWQDTRTDPICDALAGPHGIDRLRGLTGLPLATYFSGPKLRWILDHVPAARLGAQRGELLFGTIDTWLIWWLTGGPHGGVHVTDATNASRTLLMSLHSLDWHDDLLRLMDVPRAALPTIAPTSSTHSARVTRGDGPFKDEVPICGIVGDQQAAMLGQGCFDAGESKNTYGTGCFLLMNTGEHVVQSSAGLLTTVAYRFEGEAPRYALEGSVAVSGSLVQWLRDNLGIIEQSSDVEALARSVPDNGGVYIVPAFGGLFAPYWRADARGAIVGLTRHSTKAHLARAALEATAYQTRDVLEAMRKDAEQVALKGLKVDGGMAGNELLMQFQSDQIGLPVTRPRVTETTAQGAVYAAGLAVGFWSGLDELRAIWQEDRTWTPAMEIDQREALYRDWKRAVERSLNWAE